MSKQTGRDMGLYDSYEVETNEGPMMRRPMDVLIESARLGAGDTCPRCGNHAQLFFGDPEGEHWCFGCQVEKDLL